MLGNVLEWTIDVYDDYPSGSVTDPTGAASGSSRVYRGGSWNNYARDVRAANRDGYTPAVRYDALGLRLSRTAR